MSETSLSLLDRARDNASVKTWEAFRREAAGLIDE